MGHKKPKLRPVPSAAGPNLAACIPAHPSGSFLDKSPKFSLLHLDAGAYRLDKCSKYEKAAILDTMHRLSQRTWGEIWQTGKAGLGAEPLPDEAYKRLPESAKSINRKFIVFRFSLKGRLIGFHEGDTFFLVLCDRNHEVSPSGR